MMRSGTARAAAIAVAVVVMAGCSASKDEPEGDVFGARACATYEELTVDVRAKVVTNPEVREQLKAVYEDAKRSDSPELIDASSRVLAAVTSGGIPSFSVDDLVEACAAIAAKGD